MLPIRWIETDNKASGIYAKLYIDNEIACTVLQVFGRGENGPVWTFWQPNRDTVNIDAKTKAQAKIEALNKLRTELQATLEAVEAQLTIETGEVTCYRCKRRVPESEIAGGDCWMCRQPRF